MQNTQTAGDTWSKRAFKNCERHLAALQENHIYQNHDRYSRAVRDLNHILEIAGNNYEIKLSLSNYQDDRLSPLKSQDLLTAARCYKENIYFSYFRDRFEQLFASNNFTHIGLSINYLSQALCAFAILGFLKDKYPGYKIIVGGGLITTWLSHPHWQNPFSKLIDHFITGPGETGLLEIFGKVKQPTEICPNYNDLKSYKYLSPGFVLPYTTSTGCFWKKCNFCPEKAENNMYHHVSPDISVEHLHRLSEETSPALLHLLDNAVSPATLKNIAATSLFTPWYGFARIDSLLANKEFCKKLKQSGCVMLKLGLESGSQRVLDKMNKGIDLEIAAKVLGNLKDVGIKTYIYLLFGTPEESRKEAEETLRFVEHHHEHISFLNLAIFNLPICSDAQKDLEISQFFAGDLSIYSDFQHPRGWDRKSIRQFLQSDFKATGSIAQILKRDPPFFTSNHAPFMKTD